MEKYIDEYLTMYNRIHRFVIQKRIAKEVKMRRSVLTIMDGVEDTYVEEIIQNASMNLR